MRKWKVFDGSEPRLALYSSLILSPPWVTELGGDYSTFSPSSSSLLRPCVFFFALSCILSLRYSLVLSPPCSFVVPVLCALAWGAQNPPTFNFTCESVAQNWFSRRNLLRRLFARSEKNKTNRRSRGPKVGPKTHPKTNAGTTAT